MAVAIKISQLHVAVRVAKVLAAIDEVARTVVEPDLARKRVSDAKDDIERSVAVQVAGCNDVAARPFVHPVLAVATKWHIRSAMCRR